MIFRHRMILMRRRPLRQFIASHRHDHRRSVDGASAEQRADHHGEDQHGQDGRKEPAGWAVHGVKPIRRGAVSGPAVNSRPRPGVSPSMCGLFGLLRSPSAAHPEWASDAFVLLGMLAEERGTDSAGVALFTGRAVNSAARVPPGAADVSIDGCRIVKDRGPFGRIWRSDLLLALLDVAPVAIGHTRHAAWDSPAGPAAVAPLVVPGPGAGDAGIVAAHHGDVAAGALRRRFALAPGMGGTDGEVIFQALAGRTDPVSITEVLRSLIGRAALVWVERARPDRVHLARAALSPLVVAVDTERNVYWATNPRWFREVRAGTRVRFVSAVMLREGTYLQITRSPEPQITARAEFVPTARPADVDEGVWAGFTAADRDRDRARLRHILRPPAAGHDTGGFATLV